jgi:hypothetical protein
MEGTVKKTVLGSMLALGLIGFVPNHADAQIFTAFLNGRQEAPPVETMARSLAVFSFLFEDQVLFGYRFNFFFGGVEPEQVHIHNGPTFHDGPIVINLKPDGFCVDIGEFLTIYFAGATQLRGPLEGMTLTDLKNMMLGPDTYINLHTMEHPDGWIRGQFPAQAPPPPPPTP